MLKIFWSATYLAVPPLLAQPAHFRGWLECLLEAVRRPVPQARSLPYCHFYVPFVHSCHAFRSSSGQVVKLTARVS